MTQVVTLDTRARAREAERELKAKIERNLALRAHLPNRPALRQALCVAFLQYSDQLRAARDTENALRAGGQRMGFRAGEAGARAAGAIADLNMWHRDRVRELIALIDELDQE